MLTNVVRFIATWLPVGPIRIVVDPPDSLGRVTISVSTSRPDTSCYCKTNSSNFLNCTGEYRADPRILGPGNHTFMFVCMHYVNMVGYSESGDFNVILPSPPPLGEYTRVLLAT